MFCTFFTLFPPVSDSIIHATMKIHHPELFPSDTWWILFCFSLHREHKNNMNTSCWERFSVFLKYLLGPCSDFCLFLCEQKTLETTRGLPSGSVTEPKSYSTRSTREMFVHCHLTPNITRLVVVRSCEWIIEIINLKFLTSFAKLREPWWKASSGGWPELCSPDSGQAGSRGGFASRTDLIF